MPWEAHYKYFKPASGIPPHVMLYAYIKNLDVQVQNIPKKMEELLDKRQMAGPLSLDQIARAVENGPRIAGIANDLAVLRRMMQGSSIVAQASAATNQTNQRTDARLHRQYSHPDGKHRRVPPSWTFPKLSLQSMYQYWHCGDESRHIPAMKFLVASDVDFLGKKAPCRLYEMKKVMTSIDNEAIAKGAIPSDHMSFAEANTCYFRGEKAVSDAVPDKTPSGRPRVISKLKWNTVVKYLYKEKSRS
jgi:hypothetical protein